MANEDRVQVGDSMRFGVKRYIVASLAIGTAAMACASVDSSPAPGGVYRLKPGIYVAKGSSCGSPANAAIRRYDGRGISSAHSRACRATILARRGISARVSQSCVGAGSGPAGRFVERQTVTVPDALTFSLQTRGPATTYRYCPSYQLPADLRQAAN